MHADGEGGCLNCSSGDSGDGLQFGRSRARFFAGRPGRCAALMAVRNSRRTDSPGTLTVLSQSTPTASFALGKKFRGEAKRYGRGNGRGVPACLERRLERL